MSKDIFKKIQYLCKKISKVEWSGILFYSVKGSIKKPEEMEIVLEDILPMDKGTGSFTSYDFNEDVIDFIERDEDVRETWKIGHIHSHNSMAVFFSGTDMDELVDNTQNHNYYLSLIVNNYMEMTAKVAFRAKLDKEHEIPYMSLDENGESYMVDLASVSGGEKMYTYDCDIIIPYKELILPEEFTKRVDDIIKKSDKKITVPTPYFQKSKKGKNKNTKKTVRRIGGKKVTTFRENKDVMDLEDYVDDDYSTVESPWWETPPYQSSLVSKVPDPEEIEQFALFCLNGGSSVGADDDIDDLIGFYSDANVSGDTLGRMFLENYDAFYDNFFDDDSRFSTEKFETITEGIIKYYDNNLIGNFNTLKKPIDVLKRILREFKFASQ